MEARKVRIRVGAPADVDGVLELWATARSRHAVTPDTPEALRLLLDRDPAALLVAEADENLIGVLIAGFDGWRGNMARLAVAPEHRGRGIGTALVEAGEERLREVGARRVTALVGDGDADARAFWAAAGYDHDPETARYVKNV